MAIKSQVEKIGPAEATKIIEESKDVRNRSVADTHVKWLSDQMKAGKWVMNGEAIILDDEGQLVDGQHRLWAVIQSEVMIETMVTRGVDRKGFATIDTGAARTLSNVLGIVSEKSTAILASALGWIMRCEQGKMIGCAKAAGFSSSVGLSLLRKHPEIRESVDWATGIRGNTILRLIPASALTFIHHKFSSYNKAKAVEFFEQVGDIRFDTAGTATRQLRDWILRRAQNSKSGGGGKSTTEVIAIFVKAWRLFLEGRPGPKAYQWRRTGEFPEDFPTFPGDIESKGKVSRIQKKRGVKAS